MVAVSSEETPQKQDGRHQRVERGKAAVMEALMGLFAEGKYAPSIAEVAERAGVSERTLFRYFSSFNDLVAEAIAHIYPRVQPFFFAAPPDGPLEVRMYELAKLRVDFCAKYSVISITLDNLAYRASAAAGARYARSIMLTDQLKNWLGKDLERINEEKLCLLALVFDIPNVLSMYTLVGDKAARVISDAALAIIEN
jgi:AcrR family transcriptional regulator